MKVQLPVVEPNENTTHIHVGISHTNKMLVLSVYPIAIKDGLITARIFTSVRKTLCDMPRLAPKKLQAEWNAVEADLAAKKGNVWDLLQAVCKREGVRVD